MTTDQSSTPTPQTRVLGVWAHPDDEAYLSAGLMAEIVHAGGAATVVIVTDGELGFQDNDPRDLATRSAQRREEMRTAMAAIGVSDIRFLGYADGGVERIDSGLVAEQIAAVMREVHPDLTVTFGPDGMTGHPDHIATGLAATSAWLDAGIGRLGYAAVDQDWLDEWRVVHTDLGVWMGDEPAPADPEMVIWSQQLRRDALLQKRAVLAAHASQTVALAEAMGESTYCRWIADEMFRQPSPAELAAAVVAAEFGNPWRLLVGRRPAVAF